MKVLPTFRAAIDGTAVALGASSITCDTGFLIVAPAANSGTVYIGYANTITAGNTSASGIPLAAGASMFVPRGKAANAAAIYGIGSAAGQYVMVDPQ